MSEKNIAADIKDDDLKNVTGGGKGKPVFGYFKCPNCKNTAMFDMQSLGSQQYPKCSHCNVSSFICDYEFLGYEKPDFRH